MNKLNHIAFIMDGNGRWGRKKGRTRNFGHLKGVEAVRKIVKSCIKLKVPIITFYVFSSENWKRPKSEIQYLFNLIKNYFIKESLSIVNQGININIFGKINNLPSEIKVILKKIMSSTKNNKRIIVNLAINYGSRDEIVDACNKVKKKVNIKSLSKGLYTKNIANPDILIRTGGHKRLSNFMLWQLAYTEIYFIDKLWPDFSGTDFDKIISNFKKVKRNFGSI
mgnify:CR=1 FL=1